VLLVGLETAAVAADLAAAGKQIKLLADQKQEAFFTRRGFASAADFLRQYAKLSAVIARRTDGAARQSEALLLWLNPNARHPLPKDIQTALERALTPPPA
jgi:sarcosine oxidase gamma subunit